MKSIAKVWRPRYFDIGVNFSDPMFNGFYNSKQRHSPDIDKVIARAHVFNVDKMSKLPTVGIVYSYSNVSDLPMKAFINAKFDGIVHAGVGNGNFYHTIFDLAIDAQKKGIQIVRSSRIPTGATTLDAEIDDAKYNFVAAQTLNPQKARILLMLSLTKTKDWKQIQQYFNEY